MVDVSVLCPPPKDKAEAKIYRAMSSVIRKVVVNAAIHRSQSDVMEEVYLAGLWHGMKLSGPPEPKPRKPDYLNLTPTSKRSSRVLKDTPDERN